MAKKLLCFTVVLSIVFSLFSAFPVGATSNIQVGAWLGDWPSTQNIADFQTLQGKHVDIVQMYLNFDQPFSWFKANADAIYSNNSTMLLTWQPFGVTTADISAGAQDTQITQLANELKAYGKTVYLRPMHELNGNWYPWAIGYYDDPGTGVHKSGTYPNTNTTYINAWKRIVDKFRSVGAANVKFVYNVTSHNAGPNTSYLGPYPGDTYVDIISIDAYNWGTAASWSAWMSFDSIIQPSYDALKIKNKPMMIAEWASTEIGGSKAQWITDAFNVLKSSGKYDLIKYAVWFHHNKETDWRINSSAASLTAYKQAISTLSSSTPTPTPKPTTTPVPTPTPTPGSTFASTTWHLFNTTVSGVTPAGQNMQTAKSTTTGWQPTKTISTTAAYWYGSTQTGTYKAGTWTFTLWTTAPGSASNVQVALYKVNSDGSGAVQIGTAQVKDVNSTGGGNHYTTYTISSTSSVSLSNQRLMVKIVKTSGVDSVMCYNTNDFDTRLVTP